MANPRKKNMGARDAIMKPTLEVQRNLDAKPASTLEFLEIALGAMNGSGGYSAERVAHGGESFSASAKRSHNWLRRHLLFRR
jgi:hypothetical protein